MGAMAGRLGTFAFAAALACGSAAVADPVADFYRGKQIQLVVGYGPGGGYDVYARLLAQHLPRYIPGNPTIVVQNMPGAGSLRAANFIYNTAPKDGTAFGTFGRDMPLMGILGSNSNVQFEGRKFTWLGSSSSFGPDAYTLYVRNDSPVKTAEDARRPGGPTILMGSTGEGSSGADVPALLQQTTGLRFKVVMGYPDSNSIFTAVERGEVDGRFASYTVMNTSRPGWLTPDSGLHPILQYVRATRHPRMPDVPTARELALNEDARALIELAELPWMVSRPYAAPPGIPADRAKALQDAFIAMHKDADYLEAANRLQADVSPISGDDILNLLDKLSAAPPAQLEAMRKLQASSKQE